MDAAGPFEVDLLDTETFDSEPELALPAKRPRVRRFAPDHPRTSGEASSLPAGPVHYSNIYEFADFMVMAKLSSSFTGPMAGVGAVGLAGIAITALIIGVLLLARALRVLTYGWGGSRGVKDGPPRRDEDPERTPPWRRSQGSAGKEPPWRKRSRTGASADTPAEGAESGTEPCSCTCAEDLDPEDSDVDMALAVEGGILHMTRCSCRECPDLGGQRCRALLAPLKEGQQACWACTSTHGSDVPRKRTSVFTSPSASYTRTETSYHLQGKTIGPITSWNVGPSR